MKKILLLLLLLPALSCAQKIAGTGKTGPAGSVIGRNGTTNWLYVSTDSGGNLMFNMSGSSSAALIASTHLTGPAGALIGYYPAGTEWLYVPVDQYGNLEVTCASGCNAGAPIVASGTVAGATATVALFSAYTPPAAGLYRACGGYVVTTGGATGATLEAAVGFTNAGVGKEPIFGGTAESATAAGDSNSGYGLITCITLLSDASKPIQFTYIIGGSPATNPTYTYWYTVEAL